MSLKRRLYAPPVPKMPPGLVELMDGLARDVLKNNPENIYEFCAQHMQTLLGIRDGHAPKPFITLDQKIAKAQKKVNQRSEQRQRAYDDKLNSISNITTTNISDKNEILKLPNIPSEIIGDSKYPGAVEIEKDIKNEEENMAAVRGNDLGLSYKEGVSDTCIQQESKEDKKSDDTTTQQFSHVISSSEIQSSSLTKKEPQDNDFTDKDYINDIIVNKVPQEDLVGTFNETQSTVTNSDTERSTIPLPFNNDIKEVTTTLEEEELQCDDSDNNIHNEDKIQMETDVKHEDSAMKLQCDDSDHNIHNEDKTQMETDADSRKIKESDETILIDNDVTEKSIPTINILTSTSRDDVHTPINVTQFQTQKGSEDEKPLINENEENPIKYGTEDVSESAKQHDDDVIEQQNENEVNPIKCDTEDISEPSEQHDDDKILAVILNTHGCDLGLTSNQNDNPESTENTELEQSITENIDSKSHSDLAIDKSHNSNTSMDLETAAVTIQKVFRSFLFKTKTASYDDSTTVDINLLNEDKEEEESDSLNMNLKDRRSLGISRMDTVLQTVNEEKSLSLSTDDSSTLSSAATIIQAHVRGYLVRNKLNLNKTTSTNSLLDSDAPSIPSLDGESDRKGKTVLNIHIVPEGSHFVSRDESILTSMDLSLDSSPPSSVNLHPLGYDKSERRKQLKREDAIQSVSPPSNNSAKLSDEVDSVKEVFVVINNEPQVAREEDKNTGNSDPDEFKSGQDQILTKSDSNLISDAASDEMDVITPFTPVEDKKSRDSDGSSQLLHSGEFHDIVVPTNVTRSDTSVVREFQNVLVYFILWNN